MIISSLFQKKTIASNKSPISEYCTWGSFSPPQSLLHTQRQFARAEEETAARVKNELGVKLLTEFHRKDIFLIDLSGKNIGTRHFPIQFALVVYKDSVTHPHNFGKF